MESKLHKPEEPININIFCGSKEGSNPIYRQEAVNLGHDMASKNIGLVFGGRNIGIMGIIANAVLERGGRVYGVVPVHLAKLGNVCSNLTALHIVETMHERKKMMFDLSDGFITYPGGFGTYEEIFEVISWKQIGVHNKPLTVLNIENFYTPLVYFIDEATKSGFITPENRKLFEVSKDGKEALDLICKSVNEVRQLKQSG